MLDASKCYEILGLKPGASIQDVKEAYRRLALRYHPDKDSSEGNETKFMTICDAYQILRSKNVQETKATPTFDDLYPQDAVDLYAQAEARILQQRFEEAVVLLDAVLEKLPRYANAWLKKGDTLTRLKLHGDALYCYGKVLQINPESVDAWTLRGVCLSDMKKYGDALESFDEAILLDPSHAAAWNFKGVCCFILGNAAQALDCFERATKLKPDLAAAWYNKGGVLLRLGREKESAKCYEKAKKL